MGRSVWFPKRWELLFGSDIFWTVADFFPSLAVICDGSICVICDGLICVSSDSLTCIIFDSAIGVICDNLVYMIFDGLVFAICYNLLYVIYSVCLLVLLHIVGLEVIQVKCCVTALRPFQVNISHKGTIS